MDFSVENTQVIRCNREKQLLWGLLSSLFAVACTLLAVSPLFLYGLNRFAVSAGCIGALYFGQKAIWQLWCWKKDSPLFEIDEYGISDQSSAWSVGFLPWEDIQSVEVASVLLEKYIRISVAEEKAYIQKQTLWKRGLIWIRCIMGYSPISVSIGAINGKCREVIHLCEYHLESSVLKNCAITGGKPEDTKGPHF